MKRLAGNLSVWIFAGLLLGVVAGVLWHNHIFGLIDDSFLASKSAEAQKAFAFQVSNIFLYCVLFK